VGFHLTDVINEFPDSGLAETIALESLDALQSHKVQPIDGAVDLVGDESGRIEAEELSHDVGNQPTAHQDNGEDGNESENDPLFQIRVLQLRVQNLRIRRVKCVPFNHWTEIFAILRRKNRP
jgi:hypothetical protein